MKLVEFLILILDAQAQTLTRLAALFGEDILIDLLENSDLPDLPELKETPARDSPFAKATFWKSNASQTQPEQRLAYQRLEGAVRELSLPSILEFHLWAYPYYRTFIESALDLEAFTDQSNLLPLVENAIAQFELWFKALRIPTEFQKQAISAAQVPWIRFRTEALRRGGQRPVSPV